MRDAREVEMRLKKGKLRRVIRDHWLIEDGVRAGALGWGQEGRPVKLSEAFDRWERAGIDLSRPFTVVVDTVGQMITVEQEGEPR